jgi:hypothetical protein
MHGLFVAANLENKPDDPENTFQHKVNVLRALPFPDFFIPLTLPKNFHYVN